MGDDPVNATAEPAVSETTPLDQLLVRRIRLRLRRRIMWLQEIGAFYDGFERLAALLEDRDAPSAEAEWQRGNPVAAALSAAIGEADDEFRARDIRFGALSQIFGLDEAQRCLLETAVVLELDADVAELFVAVCRQGSVADVVARLFGFGRALEIAADAPVLHWGLIASSGSRISALGVDPFVRDWLRGYDGVDPALGSRARQPVPYEPIDPALHDSALAVVTRLCEPARPGPSRVWICGPHGSGRKTLAAWIASLFGMPLVALHIPAALEEARALQRTALRYALLTQSALAYSAHPPMGARAGVLEFVIATSASGSIAAGEPRIEVHALGLEQRRAAWVAVLPTDAPWPDYARELAHDYSATMDDIATVARMEPRGADEAIAFLRARRRGSFGRLAQRLETPFAWSDLVVESAVRDGLEELAYEARARRAFWERPEARRLFPQGRGLLGMFSGPAGTGKTMAAQVVARDLCIDLVRVDLATVVSKYIGETSQNIDTILRRAGAADVVLLFDEADALFARRTELRDAHDRYANSDTNYLLQAIEAYDGVALLATNQKGHVDPAFLRRLRFLVEFPRPTAELRKEIWRRILTTLSGAAAAELLEETLERFAIEIEATGAQIKFAILAGVMLAEREGAVPTGRHLLRGLERELRKEGRLLGDRERRRLLYGIV